MNEPTSTPPAPGRAEGLMCECAKVQAIEGGNRLYCPDCGNFYRRNTRPRGRGWEFEMGPVSPAPAIVAEVGDGVKRATWGDMYDDPDIQWDSPLLVLASDYDAALRTLAEVRGERDIYEKQSTRWMLLAERNAKERDAATQRAEKAETAIKAAYHELGGIGPQSSLSFHRIGIDSARGILGRALPAPATNATGSSHNQE